MSLKLVSVNIERDRQLGRVIPFLKRVAPDVVCVQELLEKDISFFEKELGMMSQWEPLNLLKRDGSFFKEGIALFSTHTFSHRVEYYRGNPSVLPINVFGVDNDSHALLVADLEHEQHVFRMATTHFVWTPDGQPDALQRQALTALLSVLDQEGDFVLCGDFNAPRGGEIFSILAARYHDNIPAQYTTSIDGALHRAGALPFMVDGLFTTPGYRARDVRLEFGVSDHAAVVATIERV